MTPWLLMILAAASSHGETLDDRLAHEPGIWRIETVVSNHPFTPEYQKGALEVSAQNGGEIQFVDDKTMLVEMCVPSGTPPQKWSDIVPAACKLEDLHAEGEVVKFSYSCEDQKQDSVGTYESINRSEYKWVSRRDGVETTAAGTRLSPACDSTGASK